jgi:nicotinamidase-related amidase
MLDWGGGRPGSERLLVCLDLQRGSQNAGRAPDGCLVNCRRMLAHARHEGWRVVHVHSKNPDRDNARPIDGLEPLLSEPVLYRSGLSAFSNRTFREMVEGGRAVELVIIGYSMTSALVGTALIAYEEALPVVMVEDAICSAVLDSATRDAIELLGRRVATPFATMACTDDVIGAPRLRRVI